MKNIGLVVATFALFIACYSFGSFSGTRLQELRQEAIMKVVRDANMLLKAEQYKFKFAYEEGILRIQYPPTPRIEAAKRMADTMEIRYGAKLYQP